MNLVVLLSLLACLAVALAAASEQESLVEVQPITSEEYKSLLNMNSGKSVIAAGRLINSAITGLSGLATGFQLGKLVPNLFSGNTQTPKGTVGGYPLCTINSNEATGRQVSDISYINMEELTEALARQGVETEGSPIINCVLVLDDGKREPTDHTTTRPPGRPKPSKTTPEPTTTKKTTTHKPRPTHTTEGPTYKPHPHPPHYPWYPSYPSYPYPPPPSYHPYPGPHQPYPPPPPPPSYYYPYIKYPVYETDEEYENDEDIVTPPVEPTRFPTINIHSYLLDKLQSIHETTTTTTTRRPTRHSTKRTTSRPSRRPHQVYNNDLDEYDDSIDYIEVSKKFNH